MEKNEPATHVPVQQPTTVIVPPHHVGGGGASGGGGGGGGCCSVPSTASYEVKNTRRAAIAIIVIHVIAVLLAGLIQIPGSLVGIIVGSAVLCNFSRCAYKAAFVLFIVGLLLDLCSLVLLTWFIATSEGEIGEGVELSTGVKIAFILPVVLGVLSFLLGAVFARKAIENWQRSGAPDVLPL